MIEVKDQAALSLVGARVAHHYGVIPLESCDGYCRIAAPDASALGLRDELGRLLGMPVLLEAYSPADIAAASKQYYGVGAETMEHLTAMRDETPLMMAEASQDLESAALPPTIIKFVNQILLEAYQDRATDIHIEPFAAFCQVRIRVDGLLYELASPEALLHFHREIVSRIKIMAGLNIAETRLPQDGRISIRIGPDEVDLRISIVPVQHGESVNIRILQSRRSLLTLEHLGFSEHERQIVEAQTQKTHGIILVTGPTGSGKTTTLYAVLDRINETVRKIVAIEDPVEYELDGICQMQVKPQIGFSFSSGLRAILRHDPDVILVGEIRDLETAELAMRASLTGHLVFSTLHTNDAPSSITRLQDLGIDSYLLCSSIECIIAQRLIRRICIDCKSPVSPSAQETRLLALAEGVYSDAAFYQGAGCHHCHDSGYRNRMVISESFVLDEEIRTLIMESAPASRLRNEALSKGMIPLRVDGLIKAKAGDTTLKEIIRVTQEDMQFYR